MGKHYNIEIQKKPEGAHIRCARFNSSMMDSRMLKEGQEFTELRDSFNGNHEIKRRASYVGYKSV